MSIQTSDLRKFEGKYPSNAETTIDYEKKDVSFNYPAKKINLVQIYKGHNLYNFSGIIVCILLICSIIINIKNYILTEMGVIKLFIFMAAMCIIIMNAFRWASVVLHLTIPRLARDFPDTNAILKKIGSKEKIINFNDAQKLNKDYIIEGKKLFLMKYDIVWFKFKYKGKNKLLRFYTKSLEKESIKGEHFDFIGIFEFKRNITEGVLKYYGST